MRAWLFVLPLMLGLVSPELAHADDIEVSGQGSVRYKKRDQNVARDDALRKALQDAVRRALADKLTTEQMVQYERKINDQIMPVAKALVPRYDIVDERDHRKVYEVVVNAYVDGDLLQDNLDKIGFSMDVGSRRSIAVVIDEYFGNDLPPSNEPMVSKVTTTTTTDKGHEVRVPAHLLTAEGQEAEAAAVRYGRKNQATPILPSGFGASPDAIAGVDNDYFEAKNTKQFQERVLEYFPAEVIRRPRANPVSAGSVSAQLLARDVRLMDGGRVADIRNTLVGTEGLLLPVLADPAELSRRAMKAGALAGTDAIMVGTTAIIYSGTSGARHKAEATLALRIVDTTTGDIVAYTTTTEVGLASNAEAAADAAADRLGQRVGKDLGEQLFQYWRNRDEKGLEISLNLVGIESTKLSIDVLDKIKGIDGAGGVEQRLFDRQSGLLSYTITTKRSLQDFKTDVLRALYTLPELASLEEEMSVGANWNFVVQ